MFWRRRSTLWWSARSVRHSRQNSAIGAIADGADPELVTDPLFTAGLDISQEYLEEAKAAVLREIERRRQIYLGNRPPLEVAGRTVIIVDDGIATGATMLAA